MVEVSGLVLPKRRPGRPTQREAAERRKLVAEAVLRDGDAKIAASVLSEMEPDNTEGSRYKWMGEETIGKAKAYIDGGYLEAGAVSPNLAGLAIWLGVSKKGVGRWCDKYPRFMEVIELLQTKQESLTHNQTAKEEINNNYGMMILSHHGYGKAHGNGAVATGMGSLSFSSGGLNINIKLVSGKGERDKVVEGETFDSIALESGSGG